MEIILLERIEKLGGIGDVVTVKNGFARNYLLPNNKALRANEANKKLFEANRAKIESDNADRRAAAEGRAKDIDGKQVVLIRQASNTGQLYGSVSVRDILDALIEDGALHICLSNSVNPASGRIESNKIGLRTCAKIMAQMAGGFKRYTENGKFTAEVILPIQAETMPSE